MNPSSIDKILEQRDRIPEFRNPRHREQLRQDVIKEAEELYRDDSRDRVGGRGFLKGYGKLRPALAVAAGIAVVFVAAILFHGTSYAWEQTIKAMDTVRFLHLVMRDDNGGIHDERWIEIEPGGTQVRCRQDIRGQNLLIVEDAETVHVHHKDSNTIVLLGKQNHFVWLTNIKTLLRDMHENYTPVIEEEADYNGQLVHRVRWPRLNAEFFIDPETKLPIAGLGYEISYETPPADAFEFVLPEGATVIDATADPRPAQMLEWMQNAKSGFIELPKRAQEALKEIKNPFDQAVLAYKADDYQTASESFEKVVDLEPGRNWAWYWLGRSQYGLGQYEKAIASYTEMIRIFRPNAPPYSHFARGLAYRANGQEPKAKEDFGRCLPAMIESLRDLEKTEMFEYADQGGRFPKDRGIDPEQARANMIGRLRLISGMDFGYRQTDAPKRIEDAVVAWENWWRQSRAEYGVVDPG